MKRLCIVSIFLLLGGCTSGLFAEEATKQIDTAELALLQDTLTKAARAQATHVVEVGHYADQITELDITVPEGIALDITQQTLADYCISGTHTSLGSGLWHVSSEETVPTEGGC
jgi:hypothetical protein